MGTIALLTWVIAIVGVVIGVVVNVALYVKGAFKPGSWRRMPRLEPMTLSRETTAVDRDYYMSVGATGSPMMDAYSRRMLRMFIFSILLVALFFISLIVYAIPH